MSRFKRILALTLSAFTLVSCVSCVSCGGTAVTDTSGESDTTAASAAQTSADTSAAVAAGADYTAVNPSDMSSLTFNSAAWNYDSTNDVYWQIGVSYCATPAAADYETMGIYVPGAYFDATDNGDGTYTCTVSASGAVGSYTAQTAPMVIPVNTPGYAAQAAPTSYNYSDVSAYLTAGFIYVYAGCRGRSNGTNADGSAYAGGAPWGVTDLKAAVRYLRYNSSVLPGDTDRIFTFGHSGGGAQSSLMGATGDSTLYYPYLESIGAAMLDASGNYISDAVCGSMCWCPITSLDVADEAYEWMMGQYSTSGTRADTTWTSALSDDLASSFASYINFLGLKDADGNALTLTESDDGIYTSGTYYDYIKSVIEQSLNNFLSDTTFPYTSGGTSSMGGMGGRPDLSGTADTSSGTLPDRSGLESGSVPTGTLPSGTIPSGMTGGDSASSESVTYDTIQDYIDSLNSDVQWVTYDAASNTATITSVAAFVEHCKNASKDVGAFDALDRSQAENDVFGTSDTDSLHFDATMAQLLADNAGKYSAFSDYDSSYAAAYAADMGNTDSLGVSTAVRQNMYNPLYYVCGSYAGYGTSTVAKYWRINTGIDQGDTSLTTETDLALALQANPAVSSVSFTTVWGQGHTTAERTGDSTTNFIAWVESCLA